jgi:hypothetical protein
VIESNKRGKEKGKFTGEDIVNIENNFEVMIENSSIELKSEEKYEKKRE